ncbi:MAG: hypothetical protein LIR50_13515 [Bacillota bacterium]|nr:hypothetical protein [Bacillota bacterium]
MKKLTTLILTISLMVSGAFQCFAVSSVKAEIKPDDIKCRERIEISYDYIQNKLKISKADLEKIKSSRHGLEEYLTSKGWKKEDIWALKKEAKFAAIDEKVKKGELTREKGEEIKTIIKNRKMHPGR